MKCESVEFSGHAIRQMFLRKIDRDEVVSAITNGRVIAEYPEDTPYPSALLLGFVRERPIHVVLGQDAATGRGIVITAYVPDRYLWSDDYAKRRLP